MLKSMVCEFMVFGYCVELLMLLEFCMVFCLIYFEICLLILLYCKLCVWIDVFVFDVLYIVIEGLFGFVVWCYVCVCKLLYMIVYYMCFLEYV